VASKGCTSLAFPSISTSIYAYPIAHATAVAVSSVRATLTEYCAIGEITFCCFSAEDLRVYQDVLADTALEL
jgi:O-acetyl-ADP-ribose deacetylase (regulator of RNase III)